MRRLSKHDVNKLSVAKLRDMMPFELVADGEVIALVHDVNKATKASHDVNKLEELPFSKGKQAKSRW